jgi:hypothetical protein
LSQEEKIARKAGLRMKEVYNKMSIDSEVYVSEINQNGPKIID